MVVLDLAEMAEMVVGPLNFWQQLIQIYLEHFLAMDKMVRAMEMVVVVGPVVPFGLTPTQ